MPELPEAETIRQDLENAVVGQRIVEVHVAVPAVVGHPVLERFRAGLRGRAITRAERVGKYLLMRLDDGRYWVVHLSLEGGLRLHRPGDRDVPGALLVVRLNDGRELVLRDDVSYTKTYLLDREDLGNVLRLPLFGPDALDPNVTWAWMRNRLGARRAMLKPLLLDQHVLAGVGSIYADEALFRAGLHPRTHAHLLTEQDWKNLHAALVAVLREGIAHRGTSAPGGRYRDLYGRKGHHQRSLQVFRRSGSPCPRCGTPITEQHVGGRPTYTCPTCQPPV